MSFSLGSIVFVLGAAQAAILLLGINIHKPLHSDLKKITSLLLFNMMMVMIYYVVILNKFEQLYQLMGPIGTAAWMAITPPFYLLCKSLLLPHWTLRAKHLIYFIIPLYFLVTPLLLLMNIDIRLWALIQDAQIFLDAWMGLFFGSGILFIGKSILLIRANNEDNSNKELTSFAYLFLATLVVFGGVYGVIRSAYVELFELILICLFLVFILILVYRIFKAAPFHAFFDLAKYGNKPLDKSQQTKLATQLERLMEAERPYLDKKLSLSDLSKLSNINTNELSQLFNSHYKSNFYEFINQYRLGHLEKIMLDPNYEQFKITALAEESGFNSKATFYKAFKSKHQLTPSQFIKAHRKND